jgi:hypothetical protein
MGDITFISTIHKELGNCNADALCDIIKAIQQYSLNYDFEYIPVLDNGLTDTFRKKYNIVCENLELQRLIDDYNILISEKGFRFLNSNESIGLEAKMRQLEYRILNDTTLDKKVILDIDQYENTMLRNIYLYSKVINYKTAIFMCGVAHRNSIIEKITNTNMQDNMKVNWKILNMQ